MPSKKKFPLSGLSKQQKEILKYLLNEREIRSKFHISWYIAEIFDKNGDRILNQNMKNNILKNNILTTKHRVSMSRSLKRLRERGLIEGYSGYILDSKTKYVKNICSYGLTEKGLKYFNKIS